MARQIKDKVLINTRLATNYGGWTYCDGCGENIGYLCYSTYDRLKFEYECQCGSKGSAYIVKSRLLKLRIGCVVLPTMSRSSLY